MSQPQILCLGAMLFVGAISAGLFDDVWRIGPKRERLLAAAWLVFWLAPPLYFIWTKGVMG